MSDALSRIASRRKAARSIKSELASSASQIKTISGELKDELERFKA
jgi:hypothetical protein